MRFIENGPFIPDELLVACDQGRVVFFCGSGVSRAAELPDFFGLADAVIKELGRSGNDRACQVLDTLQDTKKKKLFDGLVSADRIFGLLESSYPLETIENAVSKVLKPKPEASLRNHEILLKLARTPCGHLRLVTTNFDRLFDACDHPIQSYAVPYLPDVRHSQEFNGIVY